ncbi:MAG: hypothetical protein PUB20_02870 [Clostridia bacterium]|nr:hypothetical protein [Clostridia bacterium]
MKETIIRCVTAVLCVICLCVTTTVGIGKVSDAKISAAEKAGTAASDNSAIPSGSDDNAAPADDATAADDTAPADDSAATDATDASAETPADAATDNSGSQTNTNASAGTTTAGASNAAKVPATPAEITAYYNTAINKVIGAKAGYTKTRKTELKSLDGGALLKMQIVIDMVNQFLGVGTTNFTNTKGKAEYLSKASLSASDVKSATCQNSNGVYTITLTLKDGASSASASGTSDTSPIAKSGLYCGKGDKIAYDYKSSENIYSALNNTDGASVESVKGTTYNTKIVAKIDSKTGNLTSLNASFDWKADLTKVKYTVVTISEGHGVASTSVAISGIKW